MRIRLLLACTAASAFALCTAAFVVGVRTTQASDRLDAAQAQAQTAAHEAAALLALSQDYLLHQSPRAARQWHTRHASLARALQGADDLPASAAQTLQILRATHGGLRELFGKLEAATDGAPRSLARREMLADHLLAGTQHIADGVHQVSEALAAQRQDRELQRRALVRGAAITLMLVLLGLALLIERRVLRPLRLLQAGTRAVRVGDLGVRCDDRARDEFGDLARDFNAMTQALASRDHELQEKERKLRVLTERLPALVAFIDRDRRYRFCSAQYERSFGLPVERIVGGRMDELLGAAAYARLLPRVDAALGGTPVRFEQSLEVRGREIDYLCEYTPERDAAGAVIGFHVMSLDISDRRRAERQLVESLAWKRAMLDSAAFGIIAIGRDGLVRSINPAALRMLGYGADELVGRAAPERFHDPAELQARAAELSHELGRPVEPQQAPGEKARLGQVEEREWTFVRKDGSRLPVSLTVSAIRDEAAQIAGYLLLATDITERKRAEDRIRHLAHHDVLTQLPNRALLSDRLEMALKRSRRSGERVAVMMLDLDHFKRINDSLGHPIGDRLLQTVAERLRVAVRPADTVARMGGDEFVVLLDGIKDTADIARIAGAILARLAEPLTLAPHDLQVSGSLGVAVHPDGGSDAATLLQHADVAMYAAKSAGRNAWRLFDPAVLPPASARLAREGALRRALERDELDLHYQPRLELASGALVGMEALLHWHGTELGSVPAAEVLRLAEESGLTLPLGRWMLRRACRDAVEVQRRLHRPLVLALELSPRPFSQAEPADDVAAALRDSGLPGAQLELAITEGMFRLDSQRTLDMLGAIRRLGVAVSIDDFGTGPSSLSCLARHPVDRIKIDPSFVRKLPEDANAAAVTTAIVSLGHSLGMTVIAEGIETPPQRAWLSERGCDLGQGALFAPPQPLEDFVAWAGRRLAAPAARAVGAC